MKDLGKVSVRPRGDYVPALLYERLDLVRYNGDVYLALKDTAEEPSDDGINYMLLMEGLKTATTELAGKVKPDGETITVEPDGTIHGASQVPEGVTYIRDMEGEALPEALKINADSVNGITFSITENNLLRASWKEITE